MYLNLTHDNIGVLSKELKFGVPTSLRHCMLSSDFPKKHVYHWYSCTPTWHWFESHTESKSSVVFNVWTPFHLKTI